MSTSLAVLFSACDLKDQELSLLGISTGTWTHHLPRCHSARGGANPCPRYFWLEQVLRHLWGQPFRKGKSGLVGGVLGLTGRNARSLPTFWKPKLNQTSIRLYHSVTTRTEWLLALRHREHALPSPSLEVCPNQETRDELSLRAHQPSAPQGGWHWSSVDLSPKNTHSKKLCFFKLFQYIRQKRRLLEALVTSVTEWITDFIEIIFEER